MPIPTSVATTPSTNMPSGQPDRSQAGAWTSGAPADFAAWLKQFKGPGSASRTLTRPVDMVVTEIDTGIPPWAWWVLGGVAVVGVISGGGAYAYKHLKPRENPRRRKNRSRR